MSLPIAPLPAAEIAVASPPRPAGHQARSQAWTDALMQATGSSTVNPATRARILPRGAAASGDTSAGAAHPVLSDTTLPSVAATAPSNTSITIMMARQTGVGDQTAIRTEPTLGKPVRDLPETAAPTASPQPVDADQGRVAVEIRTTAAAPAADQSAGTITMGKTATRPAQNGDERQQASTPTIRLPFVARSAARSDPATSLAKGERRHHTHPAGGQTAAVSAAPSARLGDSLAITAMATPAGSGSAHREALQSRKEGIPAATQVELQGHPAAAAAPASAARSSPQTNAPLAGATIDPAAGRESPPMVHDIASTHTVNPVAISASPPTQTQTAAAAPAQSLSGAPISAPAPTEGQTADAIAGRAATPSRAVIASRGALSLEQASGDQALATQASGGQATMLQTGPLPPAQGVAPAAAEVPTRSEGKPPPAAGAVPGIAALPTPSGTAAAGALSDPGSAPVNQAAVTADAAPADHEQAGQFTAASAASAQSPMNAGPVITLAVPEPAAAADGRSATISHGRGAGSAGPTFPAAPAGSLFLPAALAAGVAGGAQSLAHDSAVGQSQPALPGPPAAIPATATALAASVVAMTQSGQSTTVLHLDPASLGALSVHIALTAGATVNVVFVPSVPQTAQLIHSALPDLHHAMTSAGLSLGEAQVGGGATGSPNGQAGNQTGDSNRFAPTTILSRTAFEADPALAKDALRGARAVA